MKRLLILIAILAAVTLGFVSCSFFMEETFRLQTDNTCIEYTTADLTEKLALPLAGFEEGTCPSLNKLGTCEESYTVEGVLAYPLDTVYYSSTGMDASSAEAACLVLDGTWVAE